MNEKENSSWMNGSASQNTQKEFSPSNMKLVGVFSFSSRNDVSVEHEFPQEESSKLKRLKN